MDQIRENLRENSFPLSLLYRKLIGTHYSDYLNIQIPNIPYFSCLQY